MMPDNDDKIRSLVSKETKAKPHEEINDPCYTPIENFAAYGRSLLDYKSYKRLVELAKKGQLFPQ